MYGALPFVYVCVKYTYQAKLPELIGDLRGWELAMAGRFTFHYSFLVACTFLIWVYFTYFF